ncbi:unnamed protein product [Penicillium pancosmium]
MDPALSGAAEEIRKEIREMIPETTSLSTDPAGSKAKVIRVTEAGNKMYGGDLLLTKIAQLKEQMKIEKSWTGYVLYCSKPTILVNQPEEGYIIPLSQDIRLENESLPPEQQERLQDGCYYHVANKSRLSPGTAIFIKPE